MAMTLADLLRSGKTPEELNALLSGSTITSGSLNPNFMAGEPYMPPQEQPVNSIVNARTGRAVPLLDAYGRPSQSQGQSQALDYSSAPVEFGGMKGYRVKGDPMTVIMGDGRIVRMGADTGADRKRMAEDLAIAAQRQKMEQDSIETQMKRLQLAELMGVDTTGSGVSSQQQAQALGVPLAPNAYAGMSRKGREALQAKEIPLAQKTLAEQEAEARNQGAAAQDAKRFMELNEKTETGPIIGSAPVSWLRSIANDDVSEMQAIQSRLTPKMREPGSGATSDFDAKMFQSALFGMNKNKGANDAIAKAMILKAKQEKDRVAFNSAYLQANNTLRGADAQWAKYAEENPIFDPTSEGAPKLNPFRVKWEQYFSGTRPVQAAKPSAATPSVDALLEKYK